MERLTVRKDDRKVSPAKMEEAGYMEEWEEEKYREKVIGGCLNKLADYEDLGLEPEELREIMNRIMCDARPEIYPEEKARETLAHAKPDRIFWMQSSTQVQPIRNCRMLQNGKLRFVRFGDIGERDFSWYGKTWVLWTGRPRKEHLENNPLPLKNS